MSETGETSRPYGPLCRYCDDGGWVYLPVTMSGAMSVVRIACNCAAGVRAIGYASLRDGVTPRENN